MLDLKNIEAFYPKELKPFKRNILREYLQYKILEIIYNSLFSEKLVFMGGTAIHIVHKSGRFSEDLDFDNLNLNKREFKELSEILKKKLTLEGAKVEIDNSFKGAYHCHLRFLNILYENGLSAHKNEKLFIQVDTESQKIKYLPDKPIINKFDVFTQINAVPMGILLAQKIYAIANRKRTMGRDFFDAIFLFSKTKADFDYLKAKMNIKTEEELKAILLSKFLKLNFSKLADDIKPFLPKPGEADKIKLFPEYIKQIKF